jgi:hypothetical protein
MNIIPFNPEPGRLEFTDEELAMIKHYGEALGGKPTPFDEEVEEHLRGMEKNRKKIDAALERAGFKRGKVQGAVGYVGTKPKGNIPL